MRRFKSNPVSLLLVFVALMFATAPVVKAVDGSYPGYDDAAPDYSNGNPNPVASLSEQALIFWANWGIFIMFAN